MYVYSYTCVFFLVKICELFKILVVQEPCALVARDSLDISANNTFDFVFKIRGCRNEIQLAEDKHGSVTKTHVSRGSFFFSSPNPIRVGSLGSFTTRGCPSASFACRSTSACDAR